MEAKIVIDNNNNTSRMLAKISNGFRMWMPNMPMMMTSARNATATEPAKATFRVLPKMTKHEIKEYLTKIYGLPVEKVNTMNYFGKRKVVRGTTKVLYFKYKDFKKAVVTFDRSYTDVGMGMRIPEIDDDDEEEDALIPEKDENAAV